MNSQYGTNAVNAQTRARAGRDALAQATRVLQDVKTLTVSAGNASLSNADRASMATSLRGLYAELLGVANRTDGNGQYLFSGLQGGTQPFNETSPGTVAYAGDQGARLMQIGPQRRIAVGDNGAEIFQRVREGNGTFVASVAAANGGTLVPDGGTVTNPQAWADPANSQDYSIRFHVNPSAVPTTTYDIVENPSGTLMVTGVEFQPGSTIALRDPAATPHSMPARRSASPACRRMAMRSNCNRRERRIFSRA